MSRTVRASGVTAGGQEGHSLMPPNRKINLPTGKTRGSEKEKKEGKGEERKDRKEEKEGKKEEGKKRRKEGKKRRKGRKREINKIKFFRNTN